VATTGDPVEPQILAQQAETMVAHYQESNEWRELMAGDIIDA
jgi:hypothetical protein